MLDRRDFLSRAFAASLLIKPARAFAQQRISPIGLQLYTVRSILEHDFDGTLAKVAAIGFKEVEFAGYFDHSPEQVRGSLRAAGLRGVSAHVGYNTLGDAWPRTIEAALTIGLESLVISDIASAARRQADAGKRVAELFNRGGDACRAAGLTFGYHNHIADFATSAAQPQPLYDVLIESTDRSLVRFQIDLCWITAAARDPVEYLKRHRGRFLSAHVKDLKRIPPLGGPPPTLSTDDWKPDMTDVGLGVIDWKSILPHCSAAGVQHFFIEHDWPADPIASADHSYRYLDSFRF